VRIRLTILAGAALGLLAQSGEAAADKVGNEFTIASGSPGLGSGCGTPSAAGLTNDGFVVTWICVYDGIDASLDGAVFNASAQRTRGILNLPGDASLYNRHSVASFDFGPFLVAWDRDRQPETDDVLAKQFSAAGVATKNAFRVTQGPGHQRQPSVAEFGNGYVVVWRSNASVPGAATIAGQRYTSTGEPIGRQFQLNTSPVGTNTPAVAALDTGGFVAVWDSKGQVYNIHGKRAGSQFSVGCTSPRVAGLQNGSFVVICLQNGDISGQRYNKVGVPIGTSFPIHTGTTTKPPAVATLVGGDFVVVWVEHQSQVGVFGRRYDTWGQPVDLAFRVDRNSSNDLDFASPAVAALSSGGFVAAWSVFTIDERTNVRGQRFSP
jgi:large repetitive protein